MSSYEFIAATGTLLVLLVGLPTLCAGAGAPVAWGFLERWWQRNAPIRRSYPSMFFWGLFAVFALLGVDVVFTAIGAAPSTVIMAYEDALSVRSAAMAAVVVITAACTLPIFAAWQRRVIEDSLLQGD